MGVGVKRAVAPVYQTARQPESTFFPPLFSFYLFFKKEEFAEFVSSSPRLLNDGISP
jgi:hypothetical protein